MHDMLSYGWQGLLGFDIWFASIVDKHELAHSRHG